MRGRSCSRYEEADLTSAGSGLRRFSLDPRKVLQPYLKEGFRPLFFVWILGFQTAHERSRWDKPKRNPERHAPQSTRLISESNAAEKRDLK